MIFSENEIDGMVLFALSESTLSSLIPLIGRRIKFQMKLRSSHQLAISTASKDRRSDQGCNVLILIF